jgi:hypothetical protein
MGNDKFDGSPQSQIRFLTSHTVCIAKVGWPDTRSLIGPRGCPSHLLGIEAGRILSPVGNGGWLDPLICWEW